MEALFARCLPKIGAVSSIFLSALLATAVTTIWPRHAGSQQVSLNRLALGQSAKVQAVSLSINPASEYDFKNRSEIDAARRNLVYQHSELLMYQYTPMSNIFREIKDKAAWCGLDGRLFWGPGERIIEGASEESRFINNPYLLVCANITLEGFSYLKSRYKDRDALARSGLPVECKPVQAVIYPTLKKEEITYDVSNYMRTCAKFVDFPKQLGNAPFNLVAYNARDFGFNYMAVSQRYSHKINKTSEHPIEIVQYIHCGGSSGYSGGCNNMSPYTEALAGLTLQGVPAQACIYLWRDKPKNVDQVADFIVTINFI